MRTRAQTVRDAALRRMTRVNHSLAVAALVGAGVLTDVVAHTASGHTLKTSASTSSKGLGGVALLTSSEEVTHPRHGSITARRSAAVHHSSAPRAATSSQSSPSNASSGAGSSAASSVQPTVVAVSGGS